MYSTVKPRYNELRYNEKPNITEDIPRQVVTKSWPGRQVSKLLIVTSKLLVGNRF
jgi:hypothetical protein